MTIAAVAHPDARQLEAYALGTLDFDDVMPLEEHLAECDSCCKLLNDVSEDSFLALIRKSAQAVTWEPAGDETALLPQGNADIPPNDDFCLSASPVTPIAPTDAERIPEALLDHGRYCILDRCGAGGMGVVYRAEHRLMGREVALKVIRPPLLRRPDAVDRFRREVRAAALLSHPNIVSAYDAEEADGSHFLVMEYVAGSDLASIVAQRGPLPVRDACDYIRQAAEGLMHAHERGMVHRDVKPQNLMLTPDGRVKILDFGLSKFASETETESHVASSSGRVSDGNSSLTSASTSLGTPDYVAPEQTADTRHADVRADIYGLGGTLYFLLTGRPPFPGCSLVEKLRGHAAESPRSVADFRDDVPPALLDVLDRMSAKRPEDRYQTPADVAEALRPFSIDASVEGVSLAAVPPSTPPEEFGDDEDDDAYRKVESPANGILAVAVLNLVLGVWSLSTMPHVYPRQSLWSIWAAVGGIGMIPATLVIMQGALRMRRLESLPWATAAAIYAVVPWTPVWILGGPMGLWALWTLSNPAVRRGFGVDPFSPPARRRWIILAGLLLLLPLGAGAGGIVYIETDRGEIAIESHDPDARIRVLQGGKLVEILDPTTNDSVTVDTGVYTIQLGSSGYSTSIPEDKEFLVHRGNRKVVTVRRVPDKGRDRLTESSATPADGSLELLRTFEGHKGHVNGLAMLPGGRAASVGADARVRVWNIKTGATLRTLPVLTGAHAAFSADGRFAVIGESEDSSERQFRRVQKTSLDTGETLWSVEIEAKKIHKLRFLPDGNVVVLTGYGPVVLLDGKTGKTIRQLLPKGWVDHDVAISPQGDRLFLRQSGGPGLVIGIADGVKQVEMKYPAKSLMTAAAWSPDGPTIATGDLGGSISIWNATTGELVRQWSADEKLVGCLTFDLSGRRLISGGADSIAVWQYPSGRLLSRVKTEKYEGLHLSLNEDGTKLLSGGGWWWDGTFHDSRDYALRLWNLPDVQEVNAEAILDRMAEAYRGCKSYRDSGIVRTTFIEGAGKRTVEKPFTTAFVRPDWFRYEFRNWMGGQERRYIIWRNGEDVRTWWDLKPQVEKPESLALALGGAVGVSGNSSKIIPALLLPNEVGGGMLTSLPDAKRVENAKLDGVECFRIEGTYTKKVLVTLWVDAQEFLVRRIDEQQQIKDFRTETTTTYDPAIDVAIPEEMLEFKAEGGHQAHQTVEVPLVVKFDGDTPPLNRTSVTRDGDAWKIDGISGRTLRLYEAPLPGADGKGITDRLLTYRAKVKTEGVTGRAYLEMWAREPNGQKSFSRGFDDAVRGTTDWAEVQTSFWIKAGERVDQADLNLVIEGGGTVWVKDVTLEAHLRPKSPAEKFGEWLGNIKIENKSQSGLVPAAPPEAMNSINLIRTFQGHTGPVHGLAFSPEGRRAVSASATGQVRMWDVQEGNTLWTFETQPHPLGARGVATSPDGKTVAVGDGNGLVYLLEAETGRELRRFQGREQGIPALAFSPDGERLAIVGWGRSDLQLWDLNPLSKVKLPTAAKGAMDVAWSPDGREIAAGGAELYRYDASSGRLSRAFDFRPLLVHSVAYASDGQRLACGRSDGSLAVINLETSERRIFSGHTEAVDSLVFSSDGGKLFSGSRDRSLRVWDVITGEELLQQTASNHNFHRIALAPDDRSLLTAGGWTYDLARGEDVGDGDYALRLWSGRMESIESNADQTPAALIEEMRLDGHQDYTLGLDYFSDGSKLVTGGAQHVYLWDTRNGRKLRELGDSERAVHAVAVFPDGTHVAAAGKGDAIRLWDVTTGTETRRFTGHTGFVECLAVSPDGTRLASGSSNWVRKERGDRTVRVWNVHTGQQTWQAELPAASNDTGAVHAVMFTPDGRHIVTAHHGPRDGISVWNAATGELVRRFSGTHSSIKTVALSPDGRVLATGHEAVDVRQRRWDDPENAVIRLWNFESGREIRRLIGHTGGIQSVAFSAAGRQLLSCSGGQFLNDAFNPYPSGDNSLRVWDVDTGRELVRQPLDKHGQNAIFSPNSEHIASAAGEVGEKPLVQIWRLPHARVETSGAPVGNR